MTQPPGSPTDSQSASPSGSQQRSQQRSTVLSARVQRVQESMTLKLNALVQAMERRGEKIYNFTVGEPDFAVSEAGKDAARKAIADNRSKYTAVPGISELRSRIARKTNLQQPDIAKTKPWTEAEVCVSNGGKQAIANVAMALLDPGDEVIIPSPYWLSYPDITLLFDGVPKIVYCPLTDDATSWKLTPTRLREAITPKTKLLILNSPSNPAGVTYTKDELRALGQVLLEKNHERVWVLSDEIYDRIVFAPHVFVSFLAACPELRDRTATVNGMSKSAAMTGWRVGWSVAPQILTSAIIKTQGQMTSGINAVAQWASVAALDEPPEAFSSYVREYQARLKLVLDSLVGRGKMKTREPEGAFYLFLRIKEFLKTGEDAVAWCERLLQEAKVALVPGEPFGEPDFVRLSLATDRQTLQEGCDRLVHFARSSR